MSKNLKMGLLLDFYGGLLTERQADALDLYYNGDLSLSEIADDLGISRQGVRDFLVRGEKKLQGFEERLGLCARFERQEAANMQIEDELNALDAYNRQRYRSGQIAQRVKNIRDLLQSAYQEEI